MTPLASPWRAPLWALLVLASLPAAVAQTPYALEVEAAAAPGPLDPHGEPRALRLSFRLRCDDAVPRAVGEVDVEAEWMFPAHLAFDGPGAVRMQGPDCALSRTREQTAEYAVRALEGAPGLRAMVGELHVHWRERSPAAPPAGPGRSITAPWSFAVAYAGALEVAVAGAVGKDGDALLVPVRVRSVGNAPTLVEVEAAGAQAGWDHPPVFLDGNGSVEAVVRVERAAGTRLVFTPVAADARGERGQAAALDVEAPGAGLTWPTATALLLSLVLVAVRIGRRRGP